MAEVPILRCRDIELSFGGLRALKGVSLDIAEGQIFGLVGPNGSGKTTLVNAITGFYPPQRGRILSAGATSPVCSRTAIAAPRRRPHVPESRAV